MNKRDIRRMLDQVDEAYLQELTELLPDEERHAAQDMAEMAETEDTAAQVHPPIRHRYAAFLTVAALCASLFGFFWMNTERNEPPARLPAATDVRQPTAVEQPTDVSTELTDAQIDACFSSTYYCVQELLDQAMQPYVGNTILCEPEKAPPMPFSSGMETIFAYYIRRIGTMETLYSYACLQDEDDEVSLYVFSDLFSDKFSGQGSIMTQEVEAAQYADVQGTAEPAALPGYPSTKLWLYDDAENGIGGVMCIGTTTVILEGPVLTRRKAVTLLCEIAGSGMTADAMAETCREAEEEYNMRLPLTLDQANYVQPYAGLVPQNTVLGDLDTVEASISSANKEMTATWRGSGEDYLQVRFYPAGDGAVHGDLPLVRIKEFNYQLSMGAGRHIEETGEHWIAFRMDLGRCRLEVEGCFADGDALSYAVAGFRDSLGPILSSGDLANDDTPSLSLEEACNIEPFRGMIPGAEKVGSLSLAKVSRGVTIGASAVTDEITLRYENENEEAIRVYFTTDPLPDAMPAEELPELVDMMQKYESNASTMNIKMSDSCYVFVDNMGCERDDCIAYLEQLEMLG